MRTVESNVAQIESILITIESFFFNQVDFADSRVKRGTNRVDSYHNRLDSGDAHNTFLESTILKQMACYRGLGMRLLTTQ